MLEYFDGCFLKETKSYAAELLLFTNLINKITEPSYFK